MITRADESDLLTALHEGVLERPRWGTFLARLRVRSRADRASLVIGRGDVLDGTATTFTAPASLAGSQVSDEYMSARLRPGRVYSHGELRDPAGAYAPNPSAARVVRVAGEPGHTAWLIVTRAGEDFAAGDAALMSALAPHLVIAMRVLATLEAQEARALAASQVTSRFGVGWLTFDAEARVVEMEPHLPELLAASGVAAIIGRPLANSPAPTRAVVDAARAFAADPKSSSRAVRLATEPRIELLLIPCGASLSRRPLAVVAIGYVRAERPLDADAGRSLAQLFGLSATEARLAITLCGGGGIAAAAVELGITLETARNYSKRVYAKVGARGQTDLVRMILGGVAPLS